MPGSAGRATSGSTSSAPAPAPSRGWGLYGRQRNPQPHPCAHPTPPDHASLQLQPPRFPCCPALPCPASPVGQAAVLGLQLPPGNGERVLGVESSSNTFHSPMPDHQEESLPAARRKGSSTKERHAILPGCLWAHTREQALERLRPAPQNPPGEQPAGQERCWWGQSLLLSRAGEQTPGSTLHSRAWAP